MRRFIKVYLTILALALLATNLALVIIYGRQFFFEATADNNAIAPTVSRELIVVNLIVLAVFAVFWLIARYYYKQSRKNYYRHDSF